MEEIHIGQYAELGKIAWDEAADVHKKYRYEKLLKAFSQPGFVSMPDIRREILLKHGVEGKSVFQPCCNNGRDILSIKNLGAAHCLGFDLSKEFIKQGREFAAAGNIDCELVQSDVYDLDARYDGIFDIGVISLGTFMWLPDLDMFFSVIARLLKKKGWLLIHEFHPISELFGKGKANGIVLSRNYFNANPEKITHGLDYFGWVSYDGAPCYRFLHKVSDVIQALINNGLTIENFEERPEHMGGGIFGKMSINQSGLPLSYLLSAVKLSNL